MAPLLIHYESQSLSSLSDLDLLGAISSRLYPNSIFTLLCKDRSANGRLSQSTASISCASDYIVN